MAGVRVHVVMPRGLVERVDAARGEGVSRGGFVRGAVERALGEPVEAVAPARPAPAEQPVIQHTPDWQMDGTVSRAEAFRRATQK